MIIICDFNSIRQGVYEKGMGGTLIFDEFDDMPGGDLFEIGEFYVKEVPPTESFAEQFSLFCPKAIFNIDDLITEIEERCLKINFKRATTADMLKLTDLQSLMNEGREIGLRATMSALLHTNKVNKIMEIDRRYMDKVSRSMLNKRPLVINELLSDPTLIGLE